MLKSTTGAWETHYHEDATPDSADIGPFLKGNVDWWLDWIVVAVFN